MGYRWENIQCHLRSTQLSSVARDLRRIPSGKIGRCSSSWSRRDVVELQKYRQDIAQVIRSEFSGDAKEAYLVLIQCIRDRPSFFAERINKAVRGLGTKDSTLIRVIVSRSEVKFVSSSSIEKFFFRLRQTDRSRSNQRTLSTDVRPIVSRRRTRRYVGRLQTFAVGHCQIGRFFFCRKKFFENFDLMIKCKRKE